eukprot:COSAG05_NODE_22_length_32312_cov_23.410890_14_plen_83_part_00
MENTRKAPVGFKEPGKWEPEPWGCTGVVPRHSGICYARIGIYAQRGAAIDAHAVFLELLRCSTAERISKYLCQDCVVGLPVA